MGANPSKKNNAFSSSALIKNEKVDKFLVQKPIKKGDGHRLSYGDFRKNSKLKNNCNFEFFFNYFILKVSEDQTSRLEKLFKHLDGENKGFITMDDFKTVYEIQVHAFRFFLACS